MKNKKILGIGEILWDLFPEGRQLGGAPANFVFHAKQLGLDAGVVSAVGQDPDGKDILEFIMKSGIKSFIGVNDKPTGTVSVSLNAKEGPVYTIHENAAWDFVEINPDAIEWAKQADAVCFGSLAQRSAVTKNTIHKILDIVADDCLNVFDVNLRQNYYSRETILSSLQKASILKTNKEEMILLGKMFGLGEEEDIIAEKALREFNLDYVALTKGAAGSCLFSTSDESWLPTPKVEVVDTVGAGDSFTAAMVAAILNGKKLGDVHKLAVEVSAFVCTRAGGTPELPDHLKKEFK